MSMSTCFEVDLFGSIILPCQFRVLSSFSDICVCVSHKLHIVSGVSGPPVWGPQWHKFQAFSHQLNFLNFLV